ncbi:hypothetical protein [Acanthopleuribacter pedis]|uniref:Transmembrane protein n=1 Tax=Acanthopleuribacter pedis TaxID=442870 RepID=A0A8J7U5L8_9BACT|nr:hypothetical protein [Acanthopleuribacter pedis]MBO1322698.1 hypothetical protein [Acanthopleuribacter pedis]
MLRLPNLFLISLIVLGLAPAWAQGPERAVPAPSELAQWRDWILYAHPEAACPEADDQTVCAWPSRLVLDLTQSGGTFEQTWTLYRDMAVPLPGNSRIWPREVRAAGKAIPVIPSPDAHVDAGAVHVPTVYLQAGTTTLRGSFTWTSSPTQLPIPAATGLLDLNLEGRPVPEPRRENNGTLVLSGRRTQANQIDSLDIYVSRILQEAVPFGITTNIKLEVSGRSREVTLHNPEMPNTRLLRVSSPLPMKRNENGDLVVQVRSGTWPIRFQSVQTDIPETLTVPEPGARWADHELWVYQANEKLRTITPRNMIAVDPTQTHLDAAYRGFPCFFAEPGQTLRLEERQRGIGTIKANDMTLTRTIWLDQNGRGATFRDVIDVNPHRDWRLEMRDPYQPGNAQIQNVSQLLTGNPQTGLTGLSLRAPTSHLKVEGRLEQKLANLPASGWNTDLDRLVIDINLPPGWRAFTAFGPETVRGDWLRSWRLWHLFWVLIIAGAVAKLWDWRLGALALACLVLIYHQLHAPRGVWLFLLVWIALARYVTIDFLKPVIKVGKNLTWLLTMVWVTAFIGQQLLSFTYPQLERVRLPDLIEGRLSGSPNFSQAVRTDGHFEPPPMMEEEVFEQKGKRAVQNYISHARKPGTKKSDKTQGDIQTGPGVPEWKHNHLRLTWNNPVDKDESVRLILLSPWQNKLLILVRIALTLLLLIALLRRDNLIPGKTTLKSAASAALLFAAGPLLGQQQQMQVAQNQNFVNEATMPTEPDQTLLEQYEARLLQKPPCGDNCLSIDSALLRVRGGTVETTLTLHALTPTTLPLPGRPTRVTDPVGKTPPLFLDVDGIVWARVPAGIRRLTLSQPLPEEGNLIIAWPQHPKRLETQTQDWQVIGVDENGRVAGQIELRPRQPAEQDEAGKTSERIQAESFLHVTRTLTLGLDWTVTTQVRTINSESVLINVPLLPGERILTSDLKADENGVAVTLSADRGAVSWKSRLDKTDSLVLQAPADRPWTETWQLTASPLWLVEWQGTPLMHYRKEGANQWFPNWKPRPGEQLTLTARRPERVGGRTLTIDEVHLNIEAGNRLQTTHFRFNLRTSTGGEYQLALPPDVEMQELTLNGKETTIIVEDQILKIGYSPGEVAIEGSWRQKREGAFVIASPQLDLGHPAVNIRHHLNIGSNRWILGTFGPQMGPSVLFWPLFGLLILIAVPLGRLKQTPLSPAGWFLLGLGVLQLGIWPLAIAATWFFAVGFYHRDEPRPKKGLEILIRLALIGFTMVFLGILAAALSQGLLGKPNMYVYGPNYPVTDLAWYNPRADGAIAPVGVVTLSIWVYRFLMLLWALWLANGLLSWLKWAWAIVFAPMKPNPQPNGPKPATRAPVQNQPTPATAPAQAKAADEPPAGRTTEDSP